jgi:hypothetical protein
MGLKQGLVLAMVVGKQTISMGHSQPQRSGLSMPDAERRQ